MILSYVLGCGSSELPPPQNQANAELARVAPPGVWEQDCAPAPGCPADGLDPAWCVLDPAPFVATFVEDQVVAISVDADAVAALGLLPGSWWTAWSDGASCDRVVATFEVTP